MMEHKYYIAYGSNLNVEQMRNRCPTAKIVGSGILQDYRLIFSRVASIVPSKGSYVPIGLWEIDQQCEKSLDRYEGFPWLYRKELLEVTVNGKRVFAMVYIMNESLLFPPKDSYYQTIRQGYRDFGLNESILEEAMTDAWNADVT